MPSIPVDPILDAPLSPAYPTGYQFWIAHWLQIIDAAKAWYHDATGRDPANTDIAHGLWRALNEGERWNTLRRAFQDTWPKPVTIEPFGALGVSGRFCTRNGQPVALIDTSDFSLFQRYLDGEDPRPLLLERYNLGFNCHRVWLLNRSVVAYRNGPPDDGIHPHSRPDFYQMLSGFCRMLNDFGAAVHLTVFTQTKLLMPDATDQQRHLDATADAVRGLGNVILSLANEVDAHDEYDVAILDGLRRPTGVLISRGSNASDHIPPHHDAPWDWEEYHTNDLPEWQRKTGHNSMEWADQSGVPCWPTENTRCPDNDNNPIHHEDAAENAILLAGAYTFHSQGGKFSLSFDRTEVTCAEACVRGARQVPLEFQRGRYVHRADLESGTVIRVHGRILDDGREYDCYVRA